MKEEEEETAATPTCYICYESRDISGQATIRDCGCRGTGGYVHQSCLEVYTIQKAMHQRRVLGKVYTGILLRCGICNQRYQGQLRTDLWNTVVDHVASTSNSISKRKAYLRRLATLQTIISCLRAILYLLEILDLHHIIHVSHSFEHIFSSLWICHSLLLLFDILLVKTILVETGTFHFHYTLLVPFLINIALYSYKTGVARGIVAATSGQTDSMFASLVELLLGKRFDVDVVQNSEEMGFIIFAAMSEKLW